MAVLVFQKSNHVKHDVSSTRWGETWGKKMFITEGSHVHSVILLSSVITSLKKKKLVDWWWPAGGTTAWGFALVSFEISVRCVVVDSGAWEWSNSSSNYKSIITSSCKIIAQINELITFHDKQGASMFITCKKTPEFQKFHSTLIWNKSYIFHLLCMQCFFFFNF